MFMWTGFKRMDLAMNLMCGTANGHCFILPNFTTKTVSCIEEAVIPTRQIRSLWRYPCMQNLGNVIHHNEKIFLPVLDVEVGHLFLIIVHVSKQSVEIWDPLIKGRAWSQRVNICHKVLRAMETVLLTNPGIDIGGMESLRGVESFQVHHDLNAPRQQNGSDCGFFVLRFISCNGGNM